MTGRFSMIWRRRSRSWAMARSTAGAEPSSNGVGTRGSTRMASLPSQRRHCPRAFSIGSPACLLDRAWRCRGGGSVTKGALVARALVTAEAETPARGAGRLRVAERAGVAWDEAGAVVFVGDAEDLPWPATHGSPDVGCIAPGFVDCHTHLPFVGWRADEFQARLEGLTYRDVAGEGGGIARSSRLLAAASDDEVLAFCRPIVHEMAAHGTTALELKTGYGLSVEGELRQARLARTLANQIAQTATVTLLPCHAVPAGMSRADWVRAACEEL